jgi:hypothetical protein
MMLCQGRHVLNSEHCVALQPHDPLDASAVHMLHHRLKKFPLSNRYLLLSPSLVRFLRESFPFSLLMPFQHSFLLTVHCKRIMQGTIDLYCNVVAQIDIFEDIP